MMRAEQVKRRAFEMCKRFGLEPEAPIVRGPAPLAAAVRNWRLQEGKPNWTAFCRWAAEKLEIEEDAAHKARRRIEHEAEQNELARAKSMNGAGI